MRFLDLNIDNSWTLFLDRDGVLNHEKEGTYILEVNQLKIYSGVFDLLAFADSIFQKIIIVTNQRCIGKNILCETEFHKIQAELVSKVEKHNGRIDDYFFAPDIDTDAPNRKPNTGMALQANLKYPEIEFKKSIMIGNNMSDMIFGKKLGMCTVFLATTKPKYENLPEEIDYQFEHVEDLMAHIRAANLF